MNLSNIKFLYREYLLGSSLFLLLVFPPCVNMLFETSSFASGVLLVLMIYLYFYWIVMLVTPFSGRHLYRFLFLLMPILLLIYIHGTVCMLLFEAFDPGRFLQSSVLLIFFISGALSLVGIIRNSSEYQMAVVGKIIFYGLLLTGLLATAGFSPFIDNSSGKVVVFFGEPSHYAVAFLPFILFMVVISKPNLKLVWVLLCFILAYRLQNLTFLIGLGMILVLVLPARKLGAALVIIIFSAILFSVNLSYFQSRLDILQGTTNLSSLVWLQGWENAYLNFIDTNGFGVGFQQFGFIWRRGAIGQTIYDMLGRDLNLTDGGSAGSKFIGEFGVFGIVILSIYLVGFFKSARWLRMVSLQRDRDYDYTRILFLSFFVMAFIELFVRSTGYFTSTGFLFITSLVWLVSTKYNGLLSRLLLRCNPAITQAS